MISKLKKILSSTLVTTFLFTGIASSTKSYASVLKSHVSSEICSLAEENTRAAGINFFHGSWSEAVEKAKSEGRLIFIDFYTEWCGPCLNMAEEVFTLPSVYDYYNTTFLNLKIDAEKGEGIEIAKKYGVDLFPTYLYIDPATQEAVHKSSSRQSAQQFIYTGKSASIPHRRSFYLESNYPDKDYDKEFLADYIEYNSSVYKRDNVDEAFAKLYKLEGSLENLKVWDIFEKHLSGLKNPYIFEVSDNYQKFVTLYGKKRVDAKLAQESIYATEEELDKLCEFEGKYTNRRIAKMNQASRSGDYQLLAVVIDSIIADPKVDQQKFLNSLKFTIRNRSGSIGDLPKEWIKKCAGYYQYIAYNLEERKDPYIHQEYAAFLEQIIKTMSNASEYFPKSIVDKPSYGKDSYTMRPDVLKPKPKTLP